MTAEALQMSDPLDETIKLVERIRQMKPERTPHRRVIPSNAVIDTAITFLQRLRRQFRMSIPAPTLVAPTDDGGVDIEWKLQMPSEAVEIVLMPKGLHEYTVRDLTKDAVDDSRDDASLEDLVQLVKLVVVGRGAVRES